MSTHDRRPVSSRIPKGACAKRSYQPMPRDRPELEGGAKRTTMTVETGAKVRGLCSAAQRLLHRPAFVPAGMRLRVGALAPLLNAQCYHSACIRLSVVVALHGI